MWRMDVAKESPPWRLLNAGSAPRLAPSNEQAGGSQGAGPVVVAGGAPAIACARNAAALLFSVQFEMGECTPTAHDN